MFLSRNETVTRTKTLDEIYHVFVTLVYYLVENLFHFQTSSNNFPFPLPLSYSFRTVRVFHKLANHVKEL